MKPNTAGIAARIMKYPVYRPLTVAGSAAITGHSLFGDSRIDLTRSTSFAVSITRLLPSLALAWNVLVVVARMMAAAPGGSPKLRPAAAGWPTRKSTLRFFRRAAPDQTTWKRRKTGHLGAVSNPASGIPLLDPRAHCNKTRRCTRVRSEEHTSELQSL